MFVRMLRPILLSSAAIIGLIAPNLRPAAAQTPAGVIELLDPPQADGGLSRLQAAGPLVEWDDRRVLRRRAARLAPSLLPSPEMAVGRELRLALFDDLVLTARIERATRNTRERESWTGRLTGTQGGQFAASFQDGVLAAQIFLGDGRQFEIRPLDEIALEVRQLDPAAFLPCGNTQAQRVVIPGAPPVPPPPEGPRLASITRFDTLVVYTPAARVAGGGTAGVEAMIQTAINAANIAYTNSQMSVEMRLVGVVEINYVEDSKLGTNLDRLTDVDGIIDDVHELRDSLGADFVVLVTAAASADACGIGWLNTSFTGASSYAFSVMQLGCLSQYTLAHEIGHNMGCAHDHLHPAYTGVYPWSFGHRFTAGAEYRTIMAYAPGTRINYFSNPNVLYNGVATGVAHGLEGEADNAGTIDATAPYFSAFRAEVAPTLSISPGFVSLAGPVGGPFSPASTELTLENLTGVAIEWSAAADPVSVPDPANPGGPELELDPVYFSPSSGVLGGGGQVAITVTPTSDSEQLPAGLHETALTVSDLTNPGEQAIALVNVEARDPSQFEFGAVGEQHAGEPFAVSLTARDSTGALVRGFTGAAEIGAFTPGGGAAGQADVGREDAFTYYPFVSFYSDVRIQMVYLDGEINISSPTLITGLSFNMTTTAAMDLENFTIRIRPFEADTLSTSTWINDGWTVAYQGTFPVGAAGARDVVFQVPFYYEGEGNLLVDISYNNAAGGESLGEIGGIFSETLRMLYHYDSGESGDPLNWSGTTPPPSDEYFLPFIRLLTEENTPVGVDPAGTGSFTGGVWTGTLTIGTEASDVRLTARTGGASGVSGSFDVVEPVVVILTEAWVDYAWGGVETGSQAQPFNTLAEALAASEDGATIHVKPGSGAEAIRITKPVRIDAPLGAATIGR